MLLLDIPHTLGAHDTVNRIAVNSYADLFGPVGRTHPPQPSNAGERVQHEVGGGAEIEFHGGLGRALGGSLRWAGERPSTGPAAA